MGKPYLSCIISGWFYFLYYKFIDEDSEMNLLAEEIRELLVKGEQDRWSNITEILLFLLLEGIT